MTKSCFYLIETDTTENIISTYSKHIRYFFDQALTSFNLVTVKPKDNLDMKLLELLSLETIELSLSENSENNFLNAINKLRNPYINELLNYLPNLTMRFKDLNYDQKIVFSFIRSILRKHECVLIEKIDEHLSAEVFNNIKSAMAFEKEQSKTHYFILSDKAEYWLDICDKYFIIENEVTRCVENKIKSKYIHTQTNVANIVSI